MSDGSADTPTTRRARKVADGLGAPPTPPRPADPVPTPDLPAVSAADAAAGAASLAPGDPDDHRLPTAQLEMAAFGPHPIAGEWVPEEPARPASLAPWALGLAIVALVASVFVGWLLVLGLVAMIVATLSLRRRHDSRRVAVWALVLAGVAVLYSAGWLLWALPQLNL